MRIGQILLSLVLGLALMPSLARADLLSVGTGLTVTWNRTGQPSGSGVMTIPVFNSNTSDPRLLDGWSLAIRIVPEAGATGTLAFGTFSYPANEVISNVAPSGSPNLTTSANGVKVEAHNADVISGQDHVPASGAALFSVNFTGATALGTFDIYAWNQNNNPVGLGSYWVDSSDNVGFSNIPNADPSVNELLLGTVTVTATPEPGTMALAFFASTGLAYAARRRKRKNASQPSTDAALSV